jgi:hypothetical protein
MDFNIFGLNVSVGGRKDNAAHYDGDSDLDIVNEGADEGDSKGPVNETYVIEDRRTEEAVQRINNFSAVTAITEGVVQTSPKDIRKLLESDKVSSSNILEALKSDYSSVETYKENEVMSKDPIVGSAMELMADDCAITNVATGKIAWIRSDDKKLESFLNNFLQNNVKIEERYWEWVFEVVKHGDLKLRRREYKTDKGNSVYYENEVEGYNIFRIEYMGQVLGFLDQSDSAFTQDGKKQQTLENPDSFVHFMSSKLPQRKKIKVRVKKDTTNEPEEIVCYKVNGTCLVDNARYIYRIVNLLDDMLILSRVARSTQFNLVKIEVGDAGPRETQGILQDVRRRIEGSTKMKKGTNMRTDPSPIPINSNVYLPTREGKGDVNIESVNDSVDVRGIMDIDYFRNKEFATVKTPKAFLGFEEELPGSMGNTNLAKLDIRYSRTIQRANNIMKDGVKELCRNYLRYRKRLGDLDNFEVVLRDIGGAEEMSRIDDFLSHSAVFDSFAGMLDSYADSIDKEKFFWHVCKLVGLDPKQFGSDKLVSRMEAIEKSEEVAPVSPTTGEEEDDDFADTGAGEDGNVPNEGAFTDVNS